jgi:hypothetical protein
MRASAVFAQHVWAREYAVTQRAELETDTVCWGIVKAIDEGGKRVQRRSHVYRQDLVLSLRVLHHELQDTDTLQDKTFP